MKIIKWLRNLIIAVIGVTCVLPYLIPAITPKQARSDLVQTGSFLTVEGVELYVERAGVVGAPAIVLVHGFGGATTHWRDTMPALGAGNYDVVALDLNGFGLSDKRFEDDFTHPTQARLIAGVLDALGIESATLVGHSMGGSVVAHFEILFPERTDALVFVDGGAFQLQGQGRTTGLAQWLEVAPVRRWARHLVLWTSASDRVLERHRTAFFDPDFLTPALFENNMGWMQSKEWELGWLGVIRDGNKNGLPYRLDVRETPTLVIWGAQDRRISLRTGRWYHGTLAGSELAIIENAGHMPMLESAEAFNKTLLSFLSKAIPN